MRIWGPPLMMDQFVALPPNHMRGHCSVYIHAMCQKIQHQLPGGFLRLAPRLHVLHLAPTIVQEHGDINLPGNEYILQCIPSVFVQGDMLSRERPIERVSGCSNAASTIAPYEARSTTCLESYRDPLL